VLEPAGRGPHLEHSRAAVRRPRPRSRRRSACAGRWPAVGGRLADWFSSPITAGIGPPSAAARPARRPASSRARRGGVAGQDGGWQGLPGRCSSSRASSSGSRPGPHPGGLVLDPPHRPADLAACSRALPVQLGEPADRRQRGAQLVRASARSVGCDPRRPPRSRKALSIWASMPFSEAVNRPTSVVAGRVGTRGTGRRGRSRRGVLDLDQRTRPPDRRPAGRTRSPRAGR
jgi:hypothetical protein